MGEYSTSEVSKKLGIHPNTIRFYEEIEFLQEIPRKENGYRIYNDIHLEQLKLIKIGLKSIIIQNGIRKQVINIIKTCAKKNYDHALFLANTRLKNIKKEKDNALESIEIVKKIIENKNDTLEKETYKRKELAEKLGLTIDTLRNWELNGLINIKRKENGYRIYNESDIQRIKIINSLRCANFSLTAILRLLNNLNNSSNTKIKETLNTPAKDEDIIYACDELITSLDNSHAENIEIIKIIKKMKKLTIQYNTRV